MAGIFAFLLLWTSRSFLNFIISFSSLRIEDCSQGVIMEREKLISETPSSIRNLIESDKESTVVGVKTLLTSRSMFERFNSSFRMETVFLKLPFSL
jgi:hypothetical protein